MTASSQTPPGALPPEQPPARPQMPRVSTLQAAAVSPLQTTAGVIRTAMANGSRTPEDIAQAEQDAGIIFDPRRAQDIWDQAYEQARAEFGAELAAAAQDRQGREWFHARWAAAGRLCEGRNLDDMLMVGEVLTALDGRAPTTLPLTITWNGEVAEPAGDGPGATTLVGGITARGGSAVFALDAEQRQALAQQLTLIEIRDIHATCGTDGCGTTDDLDASDPALFGWSRLQIAYLGQEPRWYCSDMCVFDALARAGHELAAEDRAAAVDPDQQGPVLLTAETATGWEAGGEPEDQAADVDEPGPRLPDHTVDESAAADGQETGQGARCVRCGCTEDHACEGGCHWIPNRDMVDLCSACATPAELFYAAGGPR